MRIVALDIETLGLLDAQPLPEITCACLFDGENEYCFQFYGVCPSLREQNIAKLLSLMDSAHRLVGFNAVLFDLEFIKRAFGISERQMGMWVRKTIDPFMYLKYVLHTTSGLSKLLLENHLPSKTASGREAINMAMEVLPSYFFFCLLACHSSWLAGRDALKNYCNTVSWMPSWCSNCAICL